MTALAPGPVSTEFWETAGWEVGSGQSFEHAVPRPVWVTAQAAAVAGVRGLESGRRVVVPAAGPRRDARRLLPAPRGQAAGHRVGDAPPLSGRRTPRRRDAGRRTPDAGTFSAPRREKFPEPRSQALHQGARGSGRSDAEG